MDAKQNKRLDKIIQMKQEENSVHMVKFAVAWLLLQPFQLLALSVDQNQTHPGQTARLGRIQLHQQGVPPLPPLGAAVASAAGRPLKGGSLATRMDVIVRSFCVVAVAEIFDKTWFVALICKKISFTGGFLALALHVFLAAALGVAISQFFSIRVFFLLATAYLVEFLSSDVSDDVIAERSSEAKESMQGEKDSSEWTDALGRVFLAVFVAEWGDRTQVAMITLHSSAPWLPVCLGSLVAFLVLTLSAVAAATLMQHAKLSERFVLGVSAGSFFVFSALAVHDGVVAGRG